MPLPQSPDSVAGNAARQLDFGTGSQQTDTIPLTQAGRGTEQAQEQEQERERARRARAQTSTGDRNETQTMRHVPSFFRTATENSQELIVDIMVDTVFGGYQCPDSMLNTAKGIASFYDRYEKTLEKHTSRSWCTLIAGMRTSERSWRNLSGAL
jgi:hypothetical protein